MKALENISDSSDVDLTPCYILADKMTLMDPNDYLGWYSLALVQNADEKFEQSIKTYKKIISIEQDKTPNIILFNYAKSLGMVGLLDEATIIFEKIIELEPLIDDYKMLLALCYFDQNFISRAINLINKSGSHTAQINVKCL